MAEKSQRGHELDGRHQVTWTTGGGYADRYQQFATVAVQEALRQSGILESSYAAERVGVILSTAIGGLQTLYENFVALDHQGPRRVSPFVIPMLMANGAAGLVAIDYGFRGPCFDIAVTSRMLGA